MNLAKTKRFTVLALLAAIAITLNILETTMIPPLMGVFRIGLANIMAFVALRMLGIKEMLISLAGVVLSSLILILMDLLKSSLMFTSVMSSIGHSLGQVLVVTFFYMQPAFIVVLPYFLLLSIPTGLLTGFVATIAIQRVKPLRKQD